MMDQSALLRRSSRGQRGFTLVEIMVVVVIIGLLATLVARNVLGSTDEAKLNKVKAELSVLRDAVVTYLIHHPGIPESIEELTRKDESGRGPYLMDEEVPKDPWGNEYELRQGEGGRKDFIIMSYGPNGNADDEDDITTKNMKSYTLEDMNKGI